MIPVSLVKNLFSDIPQVADDNLDEIVNFLGEYNFPFDSSSFDVLFCSLLNQFCQDLDEELRQSRALEEELDLDLKAALEDADFDVDDAIFDNIPQEERAEDGKPEKEKSFVSFQHPVGVEDKLRLQFHLRPCSVFLERLDLPLTTQAETKLRRKRKRTEDVEWKPPVAETCRPKSAVRVLRRSPRNISRIQFKI
jgi:hypothetical protein